MDDCTPRLLSRISSYRPLTPVVLLVVALLLTSGCATSLRDWARNGFKLGPNYKPPAAPVAPEFVDVASGQLPCGPACDCLWWTVFDDPTLNGLIETAYRQNLDLRSAGTRILEARAQRSMAVGNLFPQSQSLVAAYAHGQFPDGLAIPLNSSFNFWATGFNASWELDVWGRFRRSVESANAEWQASVEDYGNMLVILLTEVATNYVQLRSL